MELYIRVNITRDDELLECTATVEYYEGVQSVEPLVTLEWANAQDLASDKEGVLTHLLSCTETERILAMEEDDAGATLDQLYEEALQEITAESFYDNGENYGGPDLYEHCRQID